MRKKIVKIFIPKLLYFFIYNLKIKKLIESITQDTNNLNKVKKELRGFTSLHGFSTALNTSNSFVKVLWMFFLLILFSFLIQNSLENINDYYQYTAITKIEYVNVKPMTLPAFTLCLFSLKTKFTNAIFE